MNCSTLEVSEIPDYWAVATSADAFCFVFMFLFDETYRSFAMLKVAREGRTLCNIKIAGNGI
jgi:hypothetical protein